MTENKKLILTIAVNINCETNFDPQTLVLKNVIAGNEGVVVTDFTTQTVEEV